MVGVLKFNVLNISLAHGGGGGAYVGLKLAGREFGLEHFMDLFERSVPGFGDEEVCEDEQNGVGSEPNIAKIKRIWLVKVRFVRLRDKGRASKRTHIWHAIRGWLD